MSHRALELLHSGEQVLLDRKLGDLQVRHAKRGQCCLGVEIVDPPAPPPMKPTPVKMPSGRRMRSSTANELELLPTVSISQLACTIARDAARATRITVRNPAAWPSTSRS